MIYQTAGMNLSGNEVVSYQNANLTIGNIQDLGQNAYYDWSQPYYGYWWPSYPVYEKSRVEQAFKIIGKLLEQKIIEKELTIKEFMKLVNDVAELL